MSKPSSRTGASMDKDVSNAQDRPRLSLTRERVKDLRVQTGCKTGYVYGVNVSGTCNTQGSVTLTKQTGRCNDGT